MTRQLENVRGSDDQKRHSIRRIRHGKCSLEAPQISDTLVRQEFQENKITAQDQQAAVVTPSSS